MGEPQSIWFFPLLITGSYDRDAMSCSPRKLLPLTVKVKNRKQQANWWANPTLMLGVPANSCMVGDSCCAFSDLQGYTIFCLCLSWSLWGPASGVVRELPEYGCAGMCFHLILSGSYLSNKTAGYAQITWEETQERWRLPFITNKDTILFSTSSSGTDTGQAYVPSLTFLSSFFLSNQRRLIFKWHRNLCVLMGPYCISIHGYVFESN